MKNHSIAGVTLALCLSVAAGTVAAADHVKPMLHYDGLKKTVSVERFQATESVGGLVTADGMTAMLTDALVKDGRFVVVERPSLMGVVAEQALGQGGFVNAETAAKTGQLIGAGVIVLGTVTKFELNAGGGGLQLDDLPLGLPFDTHAELQNQKSVMEISLRMVDTTTGQVISTSSAQGSANATNARVGISDPSSGASVGGVAFQNTPIGQAGEQAIIKAVAQIAADMKGVPWSALVVDANNGKVYVNAGSARNVQNGMEFNVYRKGKVLTDPSTGEVLDAEMEKIGVIRINGVREKLSTAVVTSGETPVRGDWVFWDK